MRTPPHAKRFDIDVHHVPIPGFADRRDALVDYVTADAARSPGSNVSNSGGLRTAKDLHERTDEPAVWLRDRVVAMATTCLRAQQELSPSERLAPVAAWANINRQGDWNVPHAHAYVDWSAVASLAVPSDVSDPGRIAFIDSTGTGHDRKVSLLVTPEEGVMLVFPGSLVHLVGPHRSTSDRVSVSYDLRVVEHPLD